MQLKIVNGTDRLEFALSLFSDIDGLPKPGFIVPPRNAGGIEPPVHNKGVPFVIEENGQEQTIQLIIRKSQPTDVASGSRQTFAAVRWREEYTSPNQYPWIYYQGEYDFQSSSGWIQKTDALSY